jgi:uncharacterized protein (DUF342 family)
MIDYAAKQQLIQARMKELIGAHQQAQASVQQFQQEIFKLQGRLEQLQELAQEEAQHVHDGDLSRQASASGPNENRPSSRPRSHS